MKFVVLCVLALAMLQGCNKGDDNQDSSGACKQEYIDAWNAVGLAKIYSTSTEKSNACATLKNKGGVSCKASVTTTGVGSKTEERNISYADHKEFCEGSSSTTPSTPSTDNYNGYNGGYESTPRSKYSSSYGGACSQGFIDLYNDLVVKRGKILGAYSNETKLAAYVDLLPKCADKKIAEAETSSCLASMYDSYSYSNTTKRIYLSEFTTACKLAEESVAEAKQIELARSVRVLSKVETVEGNIENMVELKKFNSVGGATYLVDGKWLKQEQMKARLATLAEDQTVCNVTTTAVNVPATTLFRALDVKVSKDTIKIAAKEQTPELSADLNRVEMTLVTAKTAEVTVKVRCFKKTEITIDDIQTALKNTLKLDAVKTRE
tara:strand:- start:57978 stop:59111 length:1134 start_codon:yes stop_codon:yes gene_type:complete